ncbi:hypothetical protein QJS10_CPB13g01593 [Acorus calamus]|uniref:Uncharacterized protein n=1 Tax=Acorus calamus TaxID=4465 RepID=A0AAV9DHE5_ACOCL|nr:hypothetical protein QJS10_CPB13g01593 [Acorus calamus]
MAAPRRLAIQIAFRTLQELLTITPLIIGRITYPNGWKGGIWMKVPQIVFRPVEVSIRDCFVDLTEFLQGPCVA